MVEFTEEQFRTSIKIKRWFCRLKNPVKDIQKGKNRKYAKYNDCSLRQNLGFPTSRQLRYAGEFMGRNCKLLAEEYRAALREYKEARHRNQQTRTKYKWYWYTIGKGNRNSVAYRSFMTTVCKRELEHFRNNRRMKYLFHELLPRKEEQKRSHKEMRLAVRKMRDVEIKIYDHFNIPEILR